MSPNQLLKSFLILAGSVCVNCTAQAESCRDVIVGIKSSKQYLSRGQLTCFESKSKAKSAGYLPRNTTPSFAVEEDVRIDALTSSSTILLPDGTFRTFLPGIKTSTSSDGLTWTTPETVSDLSASTGEFLNNSAILSLSDGSYILIYEGVTQGNTGGVDGTTHVFYRATSTNGVTFVKSPSTPVLTAETDELGFISVPDLISISANKLRIYFVAGGDNIESATSTDAGLTWKREGKIALKGIDTPQRVDPDIIAIKGGYRLFFATGPKGTSGGLSNLRVRSATSADGTHFIVESGDRVGVASSSQIRLDPDVVKLSDGRLRIYFGESTTGGGFDLHSAISTD